MKATEVFTPGTLPKYTYYERPNRNLEEALLHAVDTPGIIASVSGPSKSGKTVLCESVIGLGSMLLVTGGGVDSEPIFWQRIRSRLKLPAGTSTSTAAGRSHEVGGAAKGGVGFLEARRESGGSMDLAGPFFVVFTAGGIIFFILAHVFIRLVFKPKFDPSKPTWEKPK